MRNALLPQSVQGLAVCQTSTATHSSGVIGPRGGSLSLEGHRLTVPRGALTEARRFTITKPAGRYLRLEVEAWGSEHYRFKAPVQITISYAECPRQHRLDRDATAWYLPEDGRGSPEAMGGVVDASRQSITFKTTHLSTYAVSY
jgi:hypothetical protein